jgi:F-type H+-transporting ATPase subunit b
MWRTLLIAVGAGCAHAAAAMANEEGPHHGSGAAGEEAALWPLVYSTINLLIFLWVLARYVLPQVRSWVRDRRTRIVKELEDAAAAKAEALRLRDEWDARLTAFARTAEQMHADARRDADRDRERILAAAQKTAEAMRRDAERAAAYEIRRTQEQLRAEMVRRALTAAEHTARTQLTAADQHRFVSEFLKQVHP